MRTIERAGPLLERYDVLLADVWGVVHDGLIAYADAGEALALFRARGGHVILLSNSPAPSPVVERILADKQVRRDAWDAVVSSGDITLAHIEECGITDVHQLGPPRDDHLFEAMSARRVALAAAQAIVCTGLIDDRTETAETYRPVLERALARRLPLVCANPDLIVDVGGVLLPCAGAIAALYEEMGGPVYWAGKPHAPAYERALALAARLRERDVEPARVLAIGDAVRTDIAGAVAFGLDALFIGQGIHRAAVMPAGRLEPERVAALLSAEGLEAVAAMPGLRW